MPVDRSIKAFKEEKLNCAQSILKGFQQQHRVEDDKIDEFKDQGGGKAEAGRCGALYAALELAAQDDRMSEIHASFKKMAGSDKCREIRKKKQLTCEQCVELAATLLSKN